MLFAAFLVGSAAAEAATITLYNSQWASMVVEGHNPAFNGSITGIVDMNRDGYQWNMNIVKVAEPYGLLGIGEETSTLGISANPGDVWTVDFYNPGTGATNDMGVTLSAYVVASGYTGWVTRPVAGDEFIVSGATASLSWDLTTGDVIGGPEGLPITSISKLGLVFIGDSFGIPDGENLSLQVVLPGTVDYALWLAEDYPGLAEPDKTDNPDGDALDNWNEYAFGGDPTVADTGFVPIFGKGVGGLEYLYVQRKGRDDLNYYLETTTNLDDGVWTNDHYSVTGTNTAFDTEFNEVTNQIPTDVEARFIRLQVE